MIARPAPFVSLLLVLLLALAACSPTAEPPDDQALGADEVRDEEPAGEGDRLERLRLAGGDFGQPSPFAWVRGPGRIQTGFVFDTLLWLDTDGELIPWLAEDWEVSDDGLEWTFSLRDNVTWHDGEPLTAADVAFTFEYKTQGPGAEAGGGSGLDVVDEVVATGEHEVVFRLPEPYAAFEHNIAGLWGMFVLPEHIWSQVDDPGRYLEDDAFVGTGAYHLVEFDDAAGTYLYEANDDFFLGAPHVQRLEFIPEMDDELLALQRGEIDAAQVSRDPVPQAQFDAFQEQFGYIETSGEWTHALHFNLEQGFPYDERDFRHAVAYAIDQEDMVERLLFGRGAPGSAGGLTPTHPDNPGDLPTYDHDPEVAGELLDGLGLQDQDGDGWRQLPDGEPFTIELLSSQRFGPNDPQLVAEYLAEVGLNVEVAMRDRATADEAGQEGTYTMALHGYGGLEGDPDTLRTRYHSEAPPRGHSGVHGYVNAEFDELAEQQLMVLDDAERTELVAQMQHILAEDLPVLSLYTPDRMLFYDESTFDAWGFTPTCTPCGATRNKLFYVTGASR